METTDSVPKSNPTNIKTDKNDKKPKMPTKYFCKQCNKDVVGVFSQHIITVHGTSKQSAGKVIRYEKTVYKNVSGTEK